MLGLVVLGFLAIYLLLSVFVVRAVMRYAKRTGRNAGWWGLIASLVMYNLLFWEVLPTIVANDYYCRTTAGFKVYKSIEEWKQENPDVVVVARESDTQKRRVTSSGVTRYVLNERFAVDHKKERPIPFLSTTIFTENVIDQIKSEILATATSVGYGHGSPMLGGGWRVIDWFDLKRCYPLREEFLAFERSIDELVLPRAQVVK